MVLHLLSKNHGIIHKVVVVFNCSEEDVLKGSLAFKVSKSERTSPSWPIRNLLDFVCLRHSDNQTPQTHRKVVYGGRTTT